MSEESNAAQAPPLLRATGVHQVEQAPRFLVIDDNPEDRMLLLRELESAFPGCQTQQIATEPEVAAAVARGGFDVVITDYSLPEQNGIEIVGQVKKKAPHCPVVLFTGKGSEEVAVEAMKAGADEYIIKSPTQYARLTSAVEKLLDSRRKRGRVHRVQRRIDVILNQLNVGVFRATIDGELIEHNPALRRMLGLGEAGPDSGDAERKAVEAFVGRVLEEMRSRGELNEPRSDTPRRDHCVQVSGEDGRRRALSISLVFGALRDGRIVVDGLCEDVTTLESTKQELLTERERLSATLRGIGDGIVSTDALGVVQVANQAGVQYLADLGTGGIGTAIQKLGGRPISELLKRPPPERRAHEVIIEGPPRRVFEVVAQATDPGGMPGGWVFVIRDVSEERAIQQHLQHQERLAAVGELAAGIAHDFNNTLQSIIGFARLLQSGLAGDKSEEFAGNIFDAGKRAAAMIRQIMDYSRKSPSKKESVDLDAQLDRSLSLLRRGVPENIELLVETGEGRRLVSANPTQLDQIIANLVVNARDAMPEGGTIRVGLSHHSVGDDEYAPLDGMKPGSWVLLEVQDTGSGIPKELLERIYEPFFTTKRSRGGTGLGLSQVHGIVHQHDGHLSVDSEVGRGTHFRIYLPATTEEPAALRDDVDSVNSIMGMGETILLVEDESAVLLAGRSSLEALGYTVEVARDGMEALEVLENDNGHIALVISDVVMPRMGGLALVNAMDKLGRETPVLVMSGYPFEAGWEADWGSRVVDCVLKPIALEQLGTSVKRALAAGQAMAALPKVGS